MKNLPLAIITALVVFLHSAAAETSAPPSVGKKNAPELLKSARESLAYTTKAARNAGEKLSAKNAAAKPFLNSLKKINASLDQADASLKDKKPDFFKAIDSARSAVTEMQVTWELTGSDDKNVIAGAKKLGGDIVALHENFSPLAARRSKGGELSATEKQKLGKIKAEQKELGKKLEALVTKHKSDRALVAGIKKIRQKSLLIARSGDTVDAFVDALDMLSSILGMFSGYSYYLPPSQRTEWVTICAVPARPAYREFYSSYSYDWSYMESSVDIYDSESIEVTSEEVTSEESYLEETDFNMSEHEEEEVADESDEIPEEDIAENDLESEQEEVADDQEQNEMADQDADEGGDEGGGDEGGGDE